MTPDDALTALLQALATLGYRWTTPTPETQRRVLARPGRTVAHDLAGIFGWSLPFSASVIAPNLLALMRTGGVLAERNGLFASTVRVSSLDNLLFLHSAYPTTESDAVFFGPDTYRFARFIKAALARSSRPVRRLVDVGCGSGAGAIVAQSASRAGETLMVDINHKALRLARINADAADVEAVAVASNVLQSVDGTFDLIIANPPYLVDDDQRTYRHGGDMLGAGLTLRIARESAERLNPGGRLLLYTASAIVDGADGFAASVIPMLRDLGCGVAYDEIDPDVFGEELERPIYGAADRIAAVGVVAIKGAAP